MAAMNTSSLESMMRMMGLSSGLGAIGGGLAGLFNNPSEAAMGYSSQVPGTVTPYYQPYIDTGLRSQGTLENQFNQLVNNPGAKYNEMGAGFEQSPGYEWQYNNAMNASNNANAAGGMLGSPAHQQQSATLAQGLASQDWWNYMDNLMGLYGQGLSGLSGLNQMGYNASDSLAGLLAQNLMNQAGLAATSAQQQNSSMGGLIGGATQAIGSFF